jgi:hypothetical protein
MSNYFFSCIILIRIRTQLFSLGLYSALIFFLNINFETAPAPQHCLRYMLIDAFENDFFCYFQKSCMICYSVDQT